MKRKSSSITTRNELMEKSSQFESSYQSDVVATWDPQIIGPIAGGNKLENICSAKTNHKIRSTKYQKSWIMFKINYQLDGHK